MNGNIYTNDAEHMLAQLAEDRVPEDDRDHTALVAAATALTSIALDLNRLVNSTLQQRQRAGGRP